MPHQLIHHEYNVALDDPPESQSPHPPPVHLTWQLEELSTLNLSPKLRMVWSSAKAPMKVDLDRDN